MSARVPWGDHVSDVSAQRRARSASRQLDVLRVCALRGQAWTPIRRIAAATEWPAQGMIRYDIQALADNGYLERKIGQCGGFRITESGRAYLAELLRKEAAV